MSTFSSRRVVVYKVYKSLMDDEPESFDNEFSAKSYYQTIKGSEKTLVKEVKTKTKQIISREY